MFRTLGIPFRWKDWRQPYFVWPLSTIGFVLLAIDEKFKGHENIDSAVHKLFGMRETALTDRIDDLIVGLYALAAAIVLFAYRSEVRRFAAGTRLFATGLVFLLAMVALDAYSNRGDGTFVLWGVVPLQLMVAEETLKLLSEGMFLAGFLNCLWAVPRG